MLVQWCELMEISECEVDTRQVSEIIAHTVTVWGTDRVCTQIFGIFSPPPPLYKLTADLCYKIHATSLTSYPFP